MIIITTTIIIIMLSAACYSRETDVEDKLSTRRGKVKSCYAKNAMIYEPSIVTKHSYVIMINQN